jgi:hypothetical protein
MLCMFCTFAVAAEGDEAAARREEELILDRPRDRKRRVRFEDSYATGAAMLSRIWWMQCCAAGSAALHPVYCFACSSVHLAAVYIWQQ